MALYEPQFDDLLPHDGKPLFFGVARVHGGILALAIGIPGLLVSYDTRSAELAKTLSIPTIQDSDLPNVTRLRDLMEPELFQDFQARFPANYDQMKDLLNENQIPNRM